MTQLVFIMGGALRKVFVQGKKITLVTAELKFQPMTIDLDKLSGPELQAKMATMKLNEADKDLIQQLANLGTEEEIIKDIVRDFQKSGWRLAKRL